MNDILSFTPMIIPSLLACPQCTYDRAMPLWYFFVLFRAAVVLGLAEGRMDLVRLTGALVFYEVFYFFVWRYLVWYSHPEMSEGVVEVLATVGLVLLLTGVPVALMTWRLSKVKYFRARAPKQMTLSRCLLMVPMLFCLGAVSML